MEYWYPLRMIAVLLITCASPALAGEAVSKLNGKLDLTTGDFNSADGQNVSGSVAMPLTPNFGLQLDGLYTDVSQREFFGGGVHLFWRDSEKGLVGITGSGVHEEDVYSLQGGFEAEYYLDLFTIGLQGGYAKIKYDIEPLPFIDTNTTDPYGTAYLSFYPIENLMLSASCTSAFDNDLFQGQIEYQTPINGLSLFAEYAQGDNDYDHGLIGMRFYFGEKKSLKKRHREDDPQNVTKNVFYGIGTYGAEFNKKAEEFVEYLSSLPPALAVADPVPAVLLIADGGSWHISDQEVQTFEFPPLPTFSGSTTSTTGTGGNHGSVTLVIVDAPIPQPIEIEEP